MIIQSQNQSGMGDVLAPTSVDPTTLITLGVAGVIILYLLMQEKKRAGATKPSRQSKPKEKEFNQTDKDVIEALVGQGAGKAQARQAVMRARGHGASGFEGLFRGALKEL